MKSGIYNCYTVCCRCLECCNSLCVVGVELIRLPTTAINCPYDVTARLKNAVGLDDSQVAYRSPPKPYRSDRAT